MTKSKNGFWSEKLRPVELLLMSLVMAGFIGFVVFFTTREAMLAAIFTGIAFIVALVVLSMLLLAITPKGDSKTDNDSENTSGH